MVIDWFGLTLYHNLGIIGSLLMLSGVIYSFKKRWNQPIGSTPFWLKHHELVSVLGAILVIVHADGSFGGLAGISMAMMVIIIISGFLGHYIYTRIPRTSLGKEKKLVELKNELDNIKFEVGEDLQSQPSNLIIKIEKLEKQITQLDTLKRQLSGWRSWHIPMTIIFVLIVIIHMISVLYYGNYFG
jgi:uncharacterized membrane protein (DUF106 family)